jgi:hypothetical protein
MCFDFKTDWVETEILPASDIPNYVLDRVAAPKQLCQDSAGFDAVVFLET